MALTRDFKETVRERLKRDPAFREALLTEAVDCLLSNDVETGKSLLCDYVNATIGIGELDVRFPTHKHYVPHNNGQCLTFAQRSTPARRRGRESRQSPSA